MFLFKVPVPHFGLALPTDVFHALAERLQEKQVWFIDYFFYVCCIPLYFWACYRECFKHKHLTAFYHHWYMCFYLCVVCFLQKVKFVIPPTLRFSGMPGEQWTMFFKVLVKKKKKLKSIHSFLLSFGSLSSPSFFYLWAPSFCYINVHYLQLSHFFSFNHLIRTLQEIILSSNRWLRLIICLQDMMSLKADLVASLINWSALTYVSLALNSFNLSIWVHVECVWMAQLRGGGDSN